MCESHKQNALTFWYLDWKTNDAEQEIRHCQAGQEDVGWTLHLTEAQDGPQDHGVAKNSE